MLYYICDLQAHIAACKELQSSGTFQQVLAAVLAVGNFLNHGGRLGNAVGFRLKALNKLHDSRSLDGKSTMLQVRRCYRQCSQYYFVTRSCRNMWYNSNVYSRNMWYRREND
jgi:hypothetical protein